MSTPSDPDHQWTRPGDSTPAAATPAPSGYGTAASPSYGKYGQGTALPPPAPAGPAPVQWGQPGYVAPTRNGPAPGDPTTLEPAGMLAQATIGLSVLLAVAVVAAAALAPNQHQFLKDTFDAAANGTEPPTAVAGGTNLASALLALVEIGAWVIGCLWLTRVRQNVVVLRQYDRRRSEVWVWLGWVIPIVNFWFPFQVVHDAVRSTAAAARVQPIGTRLWWAAWLGTQLCSLILTGSKLFPPNQGLDRGLVAIHVVVTAVALGLWLRIVLWLRRNQDAQLATLKP